MDLGDPQGLNHLWRHGNNVWVTYPPGIISTWLSWKSVDLFGYFCQSVFLSVYLSVDPSNNTCLYNAYSSIDHPSDPSDPFIHPCIPTHILVQVCQNWSRLLLELRGAVAGTASVEDIWADYWHIFWSCFWAGLFCGGYASFTECILHHILCQFMIYVIYSEILDILLCFLNISYVLMPLWW